MPTEKRTKGSNVDTPIFYYLNEYGAVEIGERGSGRYLLLNRVDNVYPTEAAAQHANRVHFKLRHKMRKEMGWK